ncbi:MAG TPA: acyl-CoA carboxylase subunit beta [Mycobacteriales bacterium]|jgi:acetyl-CoA/propionyl-CoA carboxylase carboxyl transferase subunit|nr:acyl-CoA carboxylase subunit beta [Mycobacteriales bacterium]
MTVTAVPAAKRRPVSARARLDALLDEGSFVERGALRTGVASRVPGDGVVTGLGTIGGAPVAAFCTDAAVMGGALGARGCLRIAEAIDAAVERGVPVVGLWHSGGARLQEGVASLDGVGYIFAATTRASGKVPQVSVVLGPCAGGAAYGPALTDVVVMAPEGRVFVTGPDVIRQVTGESVDMVRLGGPDPHGRRSGVVAVVADSEAHALQTARELVTLLGSPGVLDLAAASADVDLDDLLPDSPRRAYDVRPVVSRLLDPGTALELHAGWAPNVTTTLGRLGGRTVGVLANNPLRLGGCLDTVSAEKAARFVRTCDAFGVPLAVLVDVPGYLPGVDQEWDGVVRRGAKLLHAFAEAVVPRVTIVTRKAYGGAYIAMNSRSLGATACYAWPDAELAVMGPEAAVGILHKRALAAAPEGQRAVLTAQLAAEHRSIAAGVGNAGAYGVIDAVIPRAATRRVLATEIARAPQRRGAHGNIPL